MAEVTTATGHCLGTQHCSSVTPGSPSAPLKGENREELQQEPAVPLAQRLQDMLAEALRPARHSISRVQNAFRQAQSMRELLGAMVARGREMVAQIWADLVAYLLQHPLLL